MAGIDVSSGHGKHRTLNHDIPLIPFIDFLLCLVAFLLVTAVWSQMARIEADARVPSANTNDPATNATPDRELHIEVRDQRRFQLVWKEGATVVNTSDVERRPINIGTEGDVRYPALAERIAQEWKANGAHRSPTDPKRDRAVLHSDNSVAFSELIAVIDAVQDTHRMVHAGSKEELVPAFNLAFAVN